MTQKVKQVDMRLNQQKAKIQPQDPLRIRLLLVLACLTVISSEPHQAVTGVIVNTILAGTTVTTRVIHTVVDVCEQIIFDEK